MFRFFAALLLVTGRIVPSSAGRGLLVVRPAVLFLGLTILPALALGQSYEWHNRFERHIGEFGVSLEQVVASAQGIYVAGSGDCYNACYGFLAKYRAEDGKLEWQRKFHVFTETQAYSLAVNEFGAFVAGHSNDPASGDYGSFLRLYDHDGNTVWTVRDERRLDEIRQIALDADSVCVVGSVRDTNDYRAVVRCLGFDGTIRWTRTFNEKTNGGWLLQLVDGTLYANTNNQRIFVIRASDGALLDNFSSNKFVYIHDILHADGYLYLYANYRIAKYNTDGTEIWGIEFPEDPVGLTSLDLWGLDAATVVDDGLVLVMQFGWAGSGSGTTRYGAAIVTLDFDGAIRDIVKLPGHHVNIESLSVVDGALYAAGEIYAYRSSPYLIFDDFIARYSDQALLPPSLLSLAGETPAMPPRLAVLYHDLGAGPVRVAIRDAAPGSFEYRMDMSKGLKPVSFDKVADLNGNGYEEFVVVSRLPAVAEVRDSLDGSLVSSIKLGKTFEPVAATVEQRPGTAPRLAVAVRHRSKDTSLLRTYNLSNGKLLASNAYHAGFDAVDVAALPGAGDSDGRSYAILGRNRVPGEPHKIELRGGNGGLLENLWLGDSREPLQLATAGGGVKGLAVLRSADAGSADVVHIDLAADPRSTVRYSPSFAPAAMLELPDQDGNGYPEYLVYGEDAGGESVKAETRDLATGAMDYSVATGKYYRPQDAARVGPVPAFSDDAVALLGFRHANREFRVALVGVDGMKLFDLDFFTEP